MHARACRVPVGGHAAPHRPKIHRIRAVHMCGPADRVVTDAVCVHACVRGRNRRTPAGKLAYTPCMAAVTLQELTTFGWQRHTVTVRAGHGRLQGQFAQSKVRERRASRRTVASHRMPMDAGRVGVRGPGLLALRTRVLYSLNGGKKAGVSAKEKEELGVRSSRQRQRPPSSSM